MGSFDDQLESVLRRAEPEIADGGFSESVLAAMPARKPARNTTRRWTLAGAAATGSVLTSVLGAPLESVFSAYVLSFNLNTTALAVGLIAVLALPVAWMFYSK